tara:strand:- start:13894 stop:15150 length:1257 start_codon:yes stop_codon:yes gene_type:complete
MTLIARSDDLRRENQRRVLAALRADSPLSRTELAAATGLSASTVTTITSSLLAADYLVEAPRKDGGTGEEALSRRGRPQVALALNPKSASIGALTLTLNRLSAVLVDYSGSVILEVTEKVETQSLARDEFGRRFVSLLKKAVDDAGPSAGPLRHVALTVQGVSDAKGTRIHWSPILRHRDLQIDEDLSEAFGTSVSIANDANMIATALKSREPHIYDQSYAAILLSHGIGMGLVLGGRPFNGILTSAAEFGHMCHIPQGALCRCGRHGCIEAYAGDYGIWRTATGGDPEVVPDWDIDREKMAELASRAKAGDLNVRDAYTSAASAIGHGLRNLFTLLDPFPIAFVGSGVLAFDLMEPMIRTSLGRKGIGLAYDDAEFHCYENDLELTLLGTIVTGLTTLDRSLPVNKEAAGGDYATAG